MDDSPPPAHPMAEKATHTQYIAQFRVEPCPLFKQHQCQQHRPYTCYNWHFANQRRRRPIRRSDGSFNYSPDIYCDKYDENTGICPEGDMCPFLHRVSGDVERKYHLRYYKTAQCVHGTDSRGICMKNGIHCAFAHSALDLRLPQHDPNEALYASLHDERDRTAFVVDDPLWQMALTNQDHVLSCYKTELCRKPARLCRQGYACPFYHNSKDRRRPPARFKYRSTPCPAAKTVEEWLDPEMCEAGDNCGYCHTRTEQQFHPEIYKSTKCNDMLEHGYCPRAVFCAFAHHDSELHQQRTPYFMSNQTSPMTGDSPTELSRYGSPSSLNGGSGSYGIGIPRRGMSVGHRPDEFFSSSYPKAPGFERLGPISPPDRPGGRFRTYSLNMGHIDMGTMSYNDIMGTSLPSSSLGRSDSGFNAMSSALDELSLDLDTIDENSPSRQYFNALSSPMRVPSTDSYHTSPMSSFNDPLLAPMHHKLSLPSPSLSYNCGFSSHGIFSEAAIADELSKTKEELNQQYEKVAIWREGMEQARAACETWKSESEVYRMMAEKAELEKRKAIYERDQVVQAIAQLELIRNQMGSEAAATAANSLFAVSDHGSNESLPEGSDPVCARCGKERSRTDRVPCPDVREGQTLKLFIGSIGKFFSQYSEQKEVTTTYKEKRFAIISFRNKDDGLKPLGNVGTMEEEFKRIFRCRNTNIKQAN